MTKVETAVQWMEKIAADDSHGYSQTNRWGPDYDCSSFVITAFQDAGIPVKAKGANFTGNMKAVFLRELKSYFVTPPGYVYLAKKKRDLAQQLAFKKHITNQIDNIENQLQLIEEFLLKYSETPSSYAEFSAEDPKIQELTQLSKLTKLNI